MKELTKKLILWTREYLNSFGGNTKAVIGISGGKDSSVAAAVCVAAVGKNRVIGVMMPDGYQHDQDKAYELIKHLGIQSMEINIKPITSTVKATVTKAFNIEEKDLSYVLTSQMPARSRMTTLYNVAAQIGDCRVVNTCNRSENYIGYSTKFGDAAGDFSPLSNLCVREVLEIGLDLGLPEDLVYKAPEDGLSGKTDENNLGFTYAELDAYLLDDKLPVLVKHAKIEKMHAANLHKITPMPTFKKD